MAAGEHVIGGSAYTEISLLAAARVGSSLHGWRSAIDLINSPRLMACAEQIISTYVLLVIEFEMERKVRS